MTQLNFPVNYQPFNKVRIGDNIFESVQALITIGGVMPVLIGNGSSPRIWLSVPGAESGAPLRELIVDSVSLQPELTIDVFPGRVAVRLDRDTLVSATRNQDGALVVHKLDLRALALDIFKDERGLHVMGSILSNNTFVKIPVIIAL